MEHSTEQCSRFDILGGYPDYFKVVETILTVSNENSALDLLHKFRCEAVFKPNLSSPSLKPGASYRVKSIEVSYPFLATVTLVEVS